MWYVDGCVADRGRVGAQGAGRMPGHLPVLQDTHFGLLPSSREQASMFCFGINWAGCGKISNRLSKLSRACSLHRSAHSGYRAATFPSCCPSQTTPTPSPGLCLTPIPQLSLEGLLHGRGSQMGSIPCLPGWEAPVLQMRK